MTPITLDTGKSYATGKTVGTRERMTSGFAVFVEIIIPESPLNYEDIPSQDFLDSIKEFREYERRGGGKVYDTMDEIEKVLG